jgi:nicotinic acetylcholine receptor alpha-3
VDGGAVTAETGQAGAMNCVEYGEVQNKPNFPCNSTVPPVVPPPAPSDPDLSKLPRALSSPPNVNAVVAFSVVSPEIKQAIESVKYIAENMRTRNKAKEVGRFGLLHCFTE